MKNIIFLLLSSMMIISCGPSKEEQASIDSLESELIELNNKAESLSRQVRWWDNEYKKAESSELVVAYIMEAQKYQDELEIVNDEIIDVEFKLAQLK